MEIEYQYTKEDFIQFNKAYSAWALKKRLPFIVIVSLAIPLFSYNGRPLQGVSFAELAAVILVILLSLNYFVPLISGFVRISKMLRTEKKAFEKVKLTITNEGLHVESESRSDTRLWVSMLAVSSVKNFIFIRLVDKRVLLYPDRFFKSEIERDNFRGIVQNNIPTRRPFYSKTTITSNKPSYYLGLLCLVPMVGAFAGIVFIITGIAKYKDKWFVLIGIGGILFTIAFYTIVFGTDVLGMQTQLANISQKQLNGVMAKVEFYKIKNGAYPDNLDQLDKDNMTLDIYDPLRTGGKVQKPDEYNYRRIGDHYYLFSSGIDGIAGTKDDLYPQVSHTDSGKFGLIIPEQNHIP